MRTNNPLPSAGDGPRRGSASEPVHRPGVGPVDQATDHPVDQAGGSRPAERAGGSAAPRAVEPAGASPGAPLDAPLPPLGGTMAADDSALPGAGTVLSAVGTGVWRWDAVSGIVTLDAEAARLVGLPARPVTAASAHIRSRFHPVDWNELASLARLASSEGTLAEARLRVVDEHGREIRVVRTRAKPSARPGTGMTGGPDGFTVTGIIQEVTDAAEGPIAARGVTGDWRRSREAFLLDAGRALAEARSTAEVLRVAAGLSMPGFSIDGLAVWVAQGDRMILVGHHGQAQREVIPLERMPLDADYPATEVIRTGRAVYLSSEEEYRERYATTWPLVARFRRQSWAFLPLTAGGRTTGAWLAAFAQPVRFSPDERSVLTTVARMLGQALSRASTAESEQELAQGLQRSMLPRLGPQVPGLGVAGRYVPTGGSLQVGGDWYDLITLPSGHVALVIGDVQGHDVRAAGLMGQLRIALRAYAAEGHRPDAVLSRASRFLAGLTGAPTPAGSSASGAAPGQGDAGGFAAGQGGGLGTDDGPGRGPVEPGDERFATCLYVEADPVTGTLEIARAGHLNPAVQTADGTVLVRPTAGGLPLGVDPDSDYPTTRVLLDAGETLLVYTDGLIESGGHDLATGWARIRTTLQTHHGQDLENLADSLVGAVHGPSSHYTTGPFTDRRDDDIAMLLLRRTGLPEPGRATRRTELTVAQAEPQHIADARRQLRELLHDWSDDEQIDSAELLVSELLANVLRHTDGDARMVAEVARQVSSRRLRVTVADSSDDLPHKQRPGELASSGRGLVLIEFLADAWGVAPRGEGKSIWFELAEPKG